MTFNIYSTNASQGRRLIKAFDIRSDELRSIDTRAAMFHTQSDGYELVWECCVFNGNSEIENQETDREYSEFKAQIDSSLKQLQLFSKQSHMNSIKNNNFQAKRNKRSTSAQSSSFREESICDDNWSIATRKSKRRVKDDSDSPKKS